MEEKFLQVGGDLSMAIIISSESENSDEVEPPIDSSFTFTPKKGWFHVVLGIWQSVDCCIHFVRPSTVTPKWRTQMWKRGCSGQYIRCVQAIGSAQYTKFDNDILDCLELTIG